MPAIDYDQISQIYDDVRQADIDLINAFLKRIRLDRIQPRARYRLWDG